MAYLMKYHKLVREDLKKLDNISKLRVRRAIEARLMVSPEKYGEPLRGSLKGFRKLRTGDYRTVYKVIEDRILILGIRHRRDVYRVLEKRER